MTILCKKGLLNPVQSKYFMLYSGKKRCIHKLKEKVKDGAGRSPRKQAVALTEYTITWRVIGLYLAIHFYGERYTNSS